MGAYSLILAHSLACFTGGRYTCLATNVWANMHVCNAQTQTTLASRQHIRLSSCRACYSHAATLSSWKYSHYICAGHQVCCFQGQHRKCRRQDSWKLTKHHGRCIRPCLKRFPRMSEYGFRLSGKQRCFCSQASEVCAYDSEDPK
jgi:hypothetical protein